MDDLSFARRLMSNPRGGLAWANEALSGAREGKIDDLPVALWCVDEPPGREDWSADAWRDLQAARMNALGVPGQERLLDRLPQLWEAEEAWAKPGRVVGMAAWVDAVVNGASRGVEPAVRSKLAKAAAQSSLARDWMAKKTPDALANLLEEMCESRAGADSALTTLMASALPAQQAWRVLSKACIAGRATSAQKVRGLDGEAARILAATTLSDPRLAHELLHSIMFSTLAPAWDDSPDPLVAVFQALEQNPRPAMAPSSNLWKERSWREETPPPKRPAKVLRTGVGSLSLAMQLLCSDRAKAGLAALAWAAKLGAAGRLPQNSRRDGTGFEVSFAMDVRVARAESEQFRRCEVRVGKPRQVALALRDADMLNEIARLGWGWPKKREVIAMAKATQEAIKRGPKNQPLRALWRGDGSTDNAQASLMAFFEDCELRRLQGKGPIQPKRAMRM